MDQEGRWNPPEEWPDSNPPLPGWVQGSDGRWTAPDGASQLPAFDIDDVPPSRPIADVANPVAGDSPEPQLTVEDPPSVEEIPTLEATPVHQPAHAEPALPSLGFSGAEAKPRTIEVAQAERRRALIAAALAALLAAALAGGIIVLIFVL